MFRLAEHALLRLTERIRALLGSLRDSRQARPALGAAAFLLLLAAAAPAHPPFAPTRDVRVTYRLESPGKTAPDGQATNEFILRATAGGQKLRLDTPGSGAYLLIDPMAKSATMVDTKIRAFMTVPLNPKVAERLLLLDPTETYRRIGNTMVAGLPCTIWAVGPNGREGLVCTTADGVILNRIEGAAANRARMTATAVTFAAQPKALFAPPPGFEDLSPQRPPPVGGPAGGGVGGPVGGGVGGPVGGGVGGGVPVPPAPPVPAPRAPTAPPQSVQPGAPAAHATMGLPLPPIPPPTRSR